MSGCSGSCRLAKLQASGMRAPSLSSVFGIDPGAFCLDLSFFSALDPARAEFRVQRRMCGVFEEKDAPRSDAFEHTNKINLIN